MKYDDGYAAINPAPLPGPGYSPPAMSADTLLAANTCTHENHEPVYAYLLGPRRPAQPGDEVIVANGGEPVARICTDCREVLSTNWGCTDCQWIEERRMCDVVPRRLLGQPCPQHAAAHR